MITLFLTLLIYRSCSSTWFQHVSIIVLYDLQLENRSTLILRSKNLNWLLFTLRATIIILATWDSDNIISLRSVIPLGKKVFLLTTSSSLQKSSTLFDPRHKIPKCVAKTRLATWGAADGGQDTSLSQSRVLWGTLSSVQQPTLPICHKNTPPLKFYSLSPAIKSLHFRIVQISEDIITKYLI